MPAFGDMDPGCGIGIGPKKFKITRIVHPKGQTDHGRFGIRDIIIESIIDILCPVSPDTTVEDDDPPIGEVKHIIQPDIRLVITLLRDAVADKGDTVSGLKRLYLGIRRETGSQKKEECDYFFHFTTSLN
jgi:hypothetical protein